MDFHPTYNVHVASYIHMYVCCIYKSYTFEHVGDEQFNATSGNVS